MPLHCLCHIPRYLTDPVQIILDHTGLLRHWRQSCQTLSLHLDLFPNRSRNIRIVQELFPISAFFLRLLAQLLLNPVHFLPEEIFPLIILHLLRYFALQIFTHLQNLLLLRQALNHLMSSLHRILFQKDLQLLLKISRYIRSDQVRDVSRIAQSQSHVCRMGHQIRHMRVFFKAFLHGSAQSLLIIRLRLHSRQNIRFRAIIGAGRVKLYQTAAIFDFSHHTRAILFFQNFSDPHTQHHFIQIVRIQLLLQHILLKADKNLGILCYSAFQRFERRWPDHIKIDQLVRKHNKSPQGQYRKIDSFFHSFFACLRQALLSAFVKDKTPRISRGVSFYSLSVRLYSPESISLCSLSILT